MSEKVEKTYTWVFDDSESTGTIFEENLEKILEKFEKVVRHNSSTKSVFDTFFSRHPKFHSSYAGIRKIMVLIRLEVTVTGHDIWWNYVEVTVIGFVLYGVLIGIVLLEFEEIPIYRIPI